MPTREDEQGIISPAIIAPSRMLDSRIPALALDPRHASSCQDVRPEGGVLKKRTGYAAFDVDISSSGSDLSGRIQGLCQTPFGWDDDIVILLQDGTDTKYYLYDTSEADAGNPPWMLEETITPQTEYSQLSWCPAVTSGGVQVVILCDNKARLQIWDNTQDAGSKIASLTLDSDSQVLRAKVVRYYKGHLILFNVGSYADTTWTQAERRIQWMNAGDIEDVDGGDYGSNLLLGRTGGHIRGAEALADDMTIYCEHEIIRMTYIGGTSIFRFDPMVADTGLAAQNAILNLGDRHLFLADNYTVQEYCGGQYCRPIGDPINSSIQSNINKTYYENSFFVDAKGLNEGWLFIPTSGETPDTVYVIKYGMCLQEYCWYKYSMTAFAAMVHDNWYVLAGGTNIINDYDYSSKNDGSTLIDGYWESIDFTNIQNPSQRIRHQGIRFEGKGDEVTVEYSSTEGSASSWNTVGTQTLTSSWAYYELPYDSGYKRKIRYRFRNNSSGETFEIKWFQPIMLPAGER